MKRLVGASLLVGAVALAHPPPGVPVTTAMHAPPPVAVGGTRVATIQALIVGQKLDGWLLYDHQGIDPHAIELVRPSGTASRRWFYFVPASGEPTALVARADA